MTGALADPLDPCNYPAPERPVLGALMHRILLVSLLGTLASSAALAQQVTPPAKPQACILNATEVLTAPRKPNIYRSELDCGSAPTTEQQAAVLTVASKENTVDALGHLLSLGYEVEAATTRNSYSGNAIITTFVLVKEGGSSSSMPASGAAPEPSTGSAEEGDGLDDLPEAEGAPATPPAGEAAEEEEPF
jgi:hypothetical protein